MALDSMVYSCAGGREINEDSAGMTDLMNGKLFVLADGLGGHRFGELASGCAADALLNAPRPAPGCDLSDWLLQQIGAANERLLRLQKEKNAMMKSTIVALFVQEKSAYWAHVGDSRLYYFHQDVLFAVTEDHSVAYRKYKAGEITKNQIGQDADQSRLIKTLGNPDHWQPEQNSCLNRLEPGDAFLLCTDGVWEYLHEEEILIDLLKADTARNWAELLLLRIMERVQPGNDNLSLITVMVR